MKLLMMDEHTPSVSICDICGKASFALNKAFYYPCKSVLSVAISFLIQKIENDTMTVSTGPKMGIAVSFAWLMASVPQIAPWVYSIVLGAWHTAGYPPKSSISPALVTP